MPATSVSDARRCFLRSLPWLLLSLSLAARLEVDRRRAAAALPGAARTLATLQQREAALRALGAAEPAPEPLLPVLARLLDLLASGDARHGVRPGSLSVPGHRATLADGPADAEALDGLAHHLSGWTGVRSLRLDIRASYRSYEGLKAWFAELQELPLMFRRVLIEEDRLQLSLELLGA